MICLACSCANNPRAVNCRSCGATIGTNELGVERSENPSPGDPALEDRIARIESSLAALAARLTGASVSDSATAARSSPAQSADPDAPPIAAPVTAEHAVQVGSMLLTIGGPHGATVTDACAKDLSRACALPGGGGEQTMPARHGDEVIPLSAADAIALLEQTSGRRVDTDNRRVALDIARSVAMLPEPLRLIGIAAREMQRSFISLRIAFDSGEAIIAALIASRSEREKRILSILGVAGVPLSVPQISFVAGAADAAATLEQLRTIPLVDTLEADPASGVTRYALPAALAGHVPVPADHAELFGRVVDVMTAALESSPPGAIGTQLTAAETLVQRAFGDGSSSIVIALGGRVADGLAASGDLAGWGRVLALVETAAVRADDLEALARCRHDLGARAFLLGEYRRAIGYLRMAAHERELAGDAAGASASTAILVLASTAATVGAAESTADASPTAAAPTRTERVQHDLLAEREHSSEPVHPKRELAPVRRRRREGFLLFAAAAVTLALLAFILRPQPSPTLSISELSTQPASVVAGSPAQLCITAVHAAVVEVFPDSSRLAGNGRNCMTVRPAVTTTYVAVATDPDGRQVRANATVNVQPGALTAPQILSFAAYPARLKAGGTTRLCYAVNGANALRIVPRVGSLMQLRSCRSITLRAPHGYTYKLFASDDQGHIAMRTLRVDVVAKLGRHANRPVHHAGGGEQIARRAVYQFDATPAIVERGQAASLCVGVERSARGYVTHVGPLASGITRCYRVEPRTTTVYRLYVAVNHVTTVETVKVAVRPDLRRHDVARIEHR